MSLDGKKIIVTGAASGIGKETALELMRCGAQVYGIDVNETELKKLKDDNRPKIEVFTCDLSDWNATEKVFKELPVMDGLANCAGIFKPTSCNEFTEEDYEQIMGINLKGLMHVSQIVVNAMISAGKKGSIVNIASFAGFTGLRLNAVYCASKAGVIQYTNCMALELAKKGIRTNGVAPGVIDTPMGRQGLSIIGAESYLQKVPQGRFGEPIDVAKTIKFLLSDESDFINGQTIVVDGGLTCGR